MKYVTTPERATPDMCIAGGIAWANAESSALTYVDTADACYSAMIAARPGARPSLPPPPPTTIQKPGFSFDALIPFVVMLACLSALAVIIFAIPPLVYFVEHVARPPVVAWGHYWGMH